MCSQKGAVLKRLIYSLFKIHRKTSENKCIYTYRIYCLKFIIYWCLQNLRDALDCIYNARIPSAWLKESWESSSLGFWFTELIARNDQFSSWIFKGRPNSFWMTGFFNPQGIYTYSFCFKVFFIIINYIFDKLYNDIVITSISIFSLWTFNKSNMQKNSFVVCIPIFFDKLLSFSINE